MIKVAFIDDGINSEFVPNGIFFENYSADKNGVYLDTPVCTVSHGTICYQIFQSNTTNKYQLISIKVLDNETGVGNHNALLVALEWCASQNIDLINISAGTKQYTDFAPISQIIKNMQKSIIVAACSNENEIAFPACLPTVVGVRHCNREELVNEIAYFQNPYDQIEVMTCVKDVIVSLGNGETMLVNGANSFAAPLVTARIFNYLTHGFHTLECVRNQLVASSVKNISFASYDFYKGRHYKWSKCEVPVIAVPDTTAETNHIIKKLLEAFVQDEYRAITISTTQNTCVESFTYAINECNKKNFSDMQLIELYYNFMLPDIIFLQMKIEDIYVLPKELHASIILKHQSDKNSEYEKCGREYVLTITESTDKLFSRIVGLLT